ncbi:MAG TPA: 16S rRNA (guanine(966)-N(2))-methyltransferase RsmD [Oleiagrimonas sp.]|nr:16S rRNA (guanine(966)-N(2))-methyltransferase RsmD [Oleiagrimonas sp.]
MARMKTGRSETPGRVRIIGGTLRGSVLAVPMRAGLRPTPGRVRETLFNWLQPHIAGAHCLDLFAGSGALGIEALSRGAATACFVERDAGLAAALRDDLARLHQTDAQVCHADALEFLAGSPSHPYDMVFLDPPFARDLWANVADLLEAPGWLAPQAWIHVEMPGGTDFAPPPPWIMHRQGRAGEVRHVLYRRCQPIH